ncbi:MAG: hypothetical protein ABWW70_04435 [Thermoproteota archaeon]
MSVGEPYQQKLPLEPETSIAIGEEVEEEVRRLSKEVERLSVSLRELSSAVEERFEAYNSALALAEKKASLFERFYVAASMIGGWKRGTCIYNDDGVCSLWRLSEQAASDLNGIVVRKDGAYRIQVSRAPWFCGLCPLYKTQRQQ